LIYISSLTLMLLET